MSKFCVIQQYIRIYGYFCLINDEVCSRALNNESKAIKYTNNKYNPFYSNNNIFCKDR